MKMSSLNLLVLTLLFIIPALSFAQRLSPSARATLMTFGPGEDLYSVFGHTGIRIQDPTLGIDRVYNYGQFDFRTDNFYVKFLRGTLPYQIGVNDMYTIMYAYQAENRTIREQVLNLSPSQKQQLFQALETNLLPENREYRYKFYYDNCATRPRDMIVRASGDSVSVPSRNQPTGKSYRDWMNLYLGEKPWAKLGMNLAIGQPADEKTDGWHAMYLPDQVHDQMGHATLRQTNGQVIPLVTSDQTLFSAQKVFRQQVPFIFDPDVVFTALGILIALYTVRRYRVAGKVDRWLDRLLFGVSGFLGWFLLLLWVATDHGVTSWNPTLLYLMPLHLPLIYWVTGKSTTARRRTLYFGITSILILLGIFLSKVPGGVDVVFPLTLLIRCVINMQPTRRGYQTPARVI